MLPRIHQSNRTRLLNAAIYIGLLSLVFAQSASAQRYQVGDIVENFTLIDRNTNQPVSLHDMEGKIVFLEWFAYWCSFCQAGAGDIGPEIVDYYNDIGGNPAGIEVMHVGVNLQGGAESQTQSFATFYGISLVLNDFDRALANRFQDGGQPIFAIINGVDGSTSHDQWELLYTALGYGSLNAPIQTFRSVIDSVGVAAAAAPMITVQPASQSIESGRELELSVTVVSDPPATFQWKLNGENIPGATTNPLTIPNAQLANAGDYTVEVINDSGSILSEAATIELILGYTDSLIA